MIGGDRGRVDPQPLAVERPEDHLLAPVAEDVGAEARGRFRAVIRAAFVGGDVEERRLVALHPIPLGDPRPVEDLAERVAVPPDAEVARPGLAIGNHGALHVPEAAEPLAGGPHLVASVARVDVHRHAPADVRRRLAPDQGPGPCVAEFGPDRMPRLLVDVEHLQAGPVGVDVRDVEGIAVAEAGRVEALAVVVDAAGAVDDLVAAVAVDIDDAQVVVPLAAIGTSAGTGVAVEGPDAVELARAPVPGDEDRPRVVAPAHDDAGPDPVEVGDAREEAIDPVPVGVSPVGDLPSGREVVGRGEGLAGRPFEDGEEFRPFEHIAVPIPVVRLRVAEDDPRPVDRPVGRLADDLGPAVAVEVVDEERGVMGPFADVLAEVDPPEEGAVELVGLELGLAGRAPLGVVAGPHLLLEDDLVFAIAVEVADRGVVGRMPGESPEGDGEIGMRWDLRRQSIGDARGALLAADDRADGVRQAACSRRPPASTKQVALVIGAAVIRAGGPSPVVRSTWKAMPSGSVPRSRQPTKTFPSSWRIATTPRPRSSTWRGVSAPDRRREEKEGRGWPGGRRHRPLGMRLHGVRPRDRGAGRRDVTRMKRPGSFDARKISADGLRA